jgi:hypothetical protein
VHRSHLSRASSKLLPSDTLLYNAMQAIIGQELRARYETPQEVPPEMLPLLAHLDEQAGKESQALNEKQEPEHRAFHVDAAVEHESSAISIKRQAASDGPRGCTASVRTAGKFFRQTATEGHNHHWGCGRGATPQSPKPIAAFPSEHLTPSFVNIHSTAGPAAGLPRPGLRL